MNGKSKISALALLLGVLLLGGVAGAAMDRLLVRESAAAEAVTAQELSTMISAWSMLATIRCPAARNCSPYFSISLWLRRQPTESR